MPNKENKIEFKKDSISESEASNLVIDFKAIEAENSTYNQTLDSIEEEAAKASARIVSGENVLFSDLKVSERNMTVGFIGALSEIAKFLYSPEESLIEFDSMIEKHAYRNSILLVGAYKKAFLMKRNYGFMNTSEIINWMTLEIFDTASNFSKKILEKFPRPKKEDYEKEDFDSSKWPKPTWKDFVELIYESDEGKAVYKKIKNAMHGYINSVYEELKRSENICNTFWMIDIFKDIEENEILNRLELVKNIEHQYIDWIFNEKIKKAILDVIKSSFTLIDLLELSGVSLKNFLSLK